MGIVDGTCEIAGCGRAIRYDPTSTKRRCLAHLDEATERPKLQAVEETLAEFNARTRHTAHTILDVL